MKDKWVARSHCHYWGFAGSLIPPKPKVLSDLFLYKTFFRALAEDVSALRLHVARSSLLGVFSAGRFCTVDGPLHKASQHNPIRNLKILVCRSKDSSRVRFCLPRFLLDSIGSIRLNALWDVYKRY